MAIQNSQTEQPGGGDGGDGGNTGGGDGGDGGDGGNTGGGDGGDGGNTGGGDGGDGGNTGDGGDQTKYGISSTYYGQWKIYYDNDDTENNASISIDGFNATGGEGFYKDSIIDITEYDNDNTGYTFYKLEQSGETAYLYFVDDNYGYLIYDDGFNTSYASLARSGYEYNPDNRLGSFAGTYNSMTGSSSIEITSKGSIIINNASNVEIPYIGYYALKYQSLMINNKYNVKNSIVSGSIKPYSTSDFSVDSGFNIDVWFETFDFSKSGTSVNITRNYKQFTGIYTK